jgi:hypothetical protein
LGGLLLVIAAVLMLSSGGDFSVFPPKVYDEVYFILLDETSQTSADVAILVNSEQWQGLAGRGVTTRRYDVTVDAKKPEVERYLRELGAVNPPAILVIDKKTNKSVGVEANPSIESIDLIVKKYTGK